MGDRNKVILVDEYDQPIGEMDKMEAHQKGVLHRAFSVFLFNQTGKMLIQQRAYHKYHGGGLWTNACCSHPQLGEDTMDSAIERLQFELGIYCDIKKAFSFSYKASVENGLIEHEFDHVFVGSTDAEPQPNPREVQNFKWVDMKTLDEDIKANPNAYTYWFKMAFPGISGFPDTKTLL